MRKIFNKIFRYRLVSIYFILSQLVILTAIFGVLNTINKAYAKENDRLKALAKNRIELNIDTFAKKDILSYAAVNVDVGNVLAQGRMSVEVAQIGSTNRCEVLLAVNELTPYPMIRGHIPDKETDNGRNCVALGRDKYRYVYNRDGKDYITLGQEEYEVVGVIGSPVSDYWDYKIVLNIDCMSDSLKQSFSSLSNISLTVYSNKEDIMEIYNKVYSNVVNVDNTCNIVSYSKKDTGESTVSETLQKENIKTNVMVYTFCLINSIIISIFWTVQRKKELAIKRVFGFSNIRMIADIAVNLLLLMIITVIMYFVGYVLYSFIRYSTIQGMGLWSVKLILLAVGLFLITLVIAMIYPVVDIYRGQAYDKIR